MRNWGGIPKLTKGCRVEANPEKKEQQEDKERNCEGQTQKGTERKKSQLYLFLFQ